MQTSAKLAWRLLLLHEFAFAGYAGKHTTFHKPSSLLDFTDWLLSVKTRSTYRKLAFIFDNCHFIAESKITDIAAPKPQNICNW